MKDNIILMDGGMGQELYHRGIRKHKELWSANAFIEHTEIVRDVHMAFIDAGAALITTNTYCTNPWRLSKAGMEDRFDEFNDKAIWAATEAREKSGKPDTLIAASIPPLYGTYRPDKDRDMDEMLTEYHKMAQKLAPHVDILLCETMTTWDEAFAAATACGEMDKPIWLAWNLDDRSLKNGKATLRDGTTVTDAFKKLPDVKFDAFLFNCCPPEHITAAINELKNETDIRLGGYANGFTPIPAMWPLGSIESLGRRKDLSPDTYAAFVQDWIDAGAAIVGGCCEIGPAHIKKISEMLV